MTHWTPAHHTMLAKLWREGLTKAQIAKSMGATRTAIIGKIGNLRRQGDKRFPARKAGFRDYREK